MLEEGQNCCIDRLDFKAFLTQKPCNAVHSDTGAVPTEIGSDISDVEKLYAFFLATVIWSHAHCGDLMSLLLVQLLWIRSPNWC